MRLIVLALNNEMGEFPGFSFLWSNLNGMVSSKPWCLEEIALKTLLNSGSYFWNQLFDIFFQSFYVYSPNNPHPTFLKKIFQFCWQFWESIHFQEIYESYWGFKNHCCEIEGHFTKHLARVPINCQGHDRRERPRTVTGQRAYEDSVTHAMWCPGWHSGTAKEHSWKLGDIQMKSEI